MFGIDFGRLFEPGPHLLELVLRGSLVYLGLFALMRFIMNRHLGTIGSADLLMMLLIANAAQNAMSIDYKSVTDGFVLVGTIIGWNWTINWLGYRFPAFQRWMRPGPLPLIQEGKMVRRNMRRELITEDELMSKLRQQGVDDLSRVKWAFMEGDGRISVVPLNPATVGGETERQPLTGLK